ncbi:RNA-binding protein CP33, chloroplastic [Iris pallida]|uniref:RNA-binding protein CP33, chloroplastic n=1 Tax=Iris pallida TaxID=29817 RepID=A0AAX6DYH8_IRIPA|nr:RNA-binding protein CP33, chloroplastic [Iris pallida]
MAAAASAVSFHGVTAVTSLSRTVPITGALSFPNATNLKPHLRLKSPPLSLLRRHFPPRHLCSSSAPSSNVAFVDSDEDYVDDDDESEEEEEDEEGVEQEEEQVQRSRASSSPLGEPGRLYIGNLAYSMTTSQLSDIFSQAGTVKTVEIVYDRVTDRSRGFAFVTMANTEDANKAIQMFDGSQVGGRTVKVNFPEVPRGREREVMGPWTRTRSRGYIDSPYKVYAGNLGWTLTSDSLKDAFAMQPGLLGAKVIYERDSGRSRGYGFVSFSSPEEAQSAIEALNGKEVEGRPLRLNLASERFSSATIPLQVDEVADTVGSPSSPSLP